MVWALIGPRGFGDYAPEVDYAGWRERLADYHNNEMSPESKSKFAGTHPNYYIYYVSTKFTKEVGKQYADDPPITPLEPHEQPERFETIYTYKNLASLIKLPDRLWAVDEALKDIIERLEPGVHLIWPIDIVMDKGRSYPKQFYGMVIGRFLDSFSPEPSAEGSWEKYKNYDVYHVRDDTKEYVSGLALSRSAMGDAHQWRERRLTKPDIWFSDTLQGEIARAGLRIPKHIRAREV